MLQHGVSTNIVSLKTRVLRNFQIYFLWTFWNKVLEGPYTSISFEINVKINLTSQKEIWLLSCEHSYTEKYKKVFFVSVCEDCVTTCSAEQEKQAYSCKCNSKKMNNGRWLNIFFFAFYVKWNKKIYRVPFNDVSTSMSSLTIVWYKAVNYITSVNKIEIRIIKTIPIFWNIFANCFSV